MVVAQVDPRPLQRFVAAVEGVGDLACSRPRQQHQPIWRWRASDANARRALTILWPYLSALKRDQALAALSQVNATARTPWLPCELSEVA